MVVAGSNGHLDGGEYEAMLRDAGLDERLLRRVSLREQVVYPHAALTSPCRSGGDGLTRKAQSLIGMAVASLAAMRGMDALAIGGRQALTQRALVVGGGAAGMSAALELAGMGVEVDLVEREEELGGQWRSIRHQADGSDAQAALAQLTGRWRRRSASTCIWGARCAPSGAGPAPTAAPSAGKGRKKRSSTESWWSLRAAGRCRRASTCTAGTQASSPSASWRSGRRRRIWGRVVMIQCVGSREEERPYCSRICCTQAVKNALRLKAENPGVKVYILYREVRTFGFREEYYCAAREAGVVFVRYELPGKPQVTGKGRSWR